MSNHKTLESRDKDKGAIGSGVIMIVSVIYKTQGIAFVIAVSALGIYQISQSWYIIYVWRNALIDHGKVLISLTSSDDYNLISVLWKYHIIC